MLNRFLLVFQRPKIIFVIRKVYTNDCEDLCIASLGCDKDGLESGPVERESSLVTDCVSSSSF